MKCPTNVIGRATRIIAADAVTAAFSPPGMAPLKSWKIVTEATPEPRGIDRSGRGTK